MADPRPRIVTTNAGGDLRLRPEFIVPPAQLEAAGTVGQVLGRTANGWEPVAPPAGVTIKGSYPTVGDLQTAHPTGQEGDGYLVAGDLYVWNGTAWENVGTIQGPAGADGAPGVNSWEAIPDKPDVALLDANGKLDASVVVPLESLDAAVVAAGATEAAARQAIGAVDEVAVTVRSGVVAPTVAAMTASTYPVGTVVRTLGYHAAHDGGACTYRVTAAAAAGYDIAGSGIAFRPVLSGVVHPKQFGTVNDGTAFDNWGLQRCYDYAYDFNVGHIDGQKLLYIIGTVNVYDLVERGWAHTGALVRAGRKLTNFRFKTAPGSTEGTVPLSVFLENNGLPTILEDIEIDGNATNVVGPTEPTKEDGGLHCIHLYHTQDDDLAAAGRDFRPCGDILMRRVRLKDSYSYGVRMKHLDCLLRLEDCEIEHRGLGVQAHTTRFEVRGGKILTKPARPLMVAMPFHIEIEFSNNYIGTKQQSISIRGVRRTSTLTTEPFLFGMHYVPMQGAKLDLVEVVDCDNGGAGHGVLLYGGTGITAEVAKVSMRGNKAPAGNWLRIEGNVSVGEVESDNNEMAAPGGATVGNLRLIGTKISKLSITNTHFIGNNIVQLGDGSSIGRLSFHRCTSVPLGSSGIFRWNAARVDHMSVTDSQFDASGTAPNTTSLWEAGFGIVEMNNVRFLAGSDGMHNRILYARASPRTDMRLSNIIVQGRGPRAANEGFLYHGTVAAGYVVMDNVRYERLAVPRVDGLPNPETRLIRRGCNPLDAPTMDVPSYTTGTRPPALAGDSVFDSTLGLPVWCKTSGVFAVQTVTVTAGATASGDVTVTLNGTAFPVAVLDTDTTPDLVAAKLRAAIYAGWTATGSGAAVVFTATTQAPRSAPVFNGAATGVTATAVSTTTGVAAAWVKADGTTA